MLWGKKTKESITLRTEVSYTQYAKEGKDQLKHYYKYPSGEGGRG